ncbi:vitamin K-dependent protein C [Aphelenchoides avenae]|nr:vitamin K-dependent protein C [Aphelenchus avenae]
MNVSSITKDGEAAILELKVEWPRFLNSAGTAPENKYFQPVCLPANWQENIGEYGVVAGFGTNETLDSDSRIRSANQGILRENIVPYRDLSVCIQSGSVPHSDKYICAVGNQRDVAMGDEGGPLMTNIYGQWYQVGIVTRYRKDVDLSGGLKLNGTLYDRIPQHCEWIAKTVGGAAACLQIEPDPACDPIFNPCPSTLSP